jgi:hypothetical protein
VVGALWTIGPYVYADRDHRESIDSREVRKVAEAACKQMEAEVKAGRDPAEAARTMVRRMRELDPEVLDEDIPTEAWLDDWDRLLAAHRAGEPVPRSDGVFITRRMDELVKDLRPCQVPRALLPSRR